MVASSRSSPLIIVRPRVLYSSLFVWLSLSGGRFLAPQLQTLGLTEAQIGGLFALQTVVSSGCASVAGSVADASEHGRAGVLAAGVVVATTAFLLQALPLIIPPLSSVYWHVALRCIYAGASSFIHPVLDGLTLDFLEHQPGSEKADFGKERLYGAIWWAIANLIMGPSLDYFGFTILYPYALVAAVAVLGTLALYTRDQGRRVHNSFEAVATTEERGDDEVLPRPGLQRRKSHLVEHDNNHLPFRQLLGMVCGTTLGTAFMIAVFCLSIGTCVVENLIFLYFEVLGSTYTLCAFTVLLTVLFEIPIFHIAPQLLERYGTPKLLLMACFCYMTRVVGYSLVPQGQPWWVLLLEPLHGVTYACSSLSAVEFVARSMPPGYDASGQGMLFALKGCGSILGLLFGGIGEDLLGPRTMYRLLAAVVTIGFTLLSVAAALKKPKEATSSVQLELVDQTLRDAKISSG